MNVLVIDDDDAKRALIIEALKQCGLGDGNIAQARSALSARRIFNERSFDLVILDLVLPATDKSGNESPEIGYGLLQELSEEGVAKRIVGATAHEEALAEYEAGFRELTEQLLLVSTSTSEWKQSLKALVMQAQAVAVRRPSYDVDICFVCALRSPEYDAVLALSGIKWEAEEVLASHTLYRQGRIEHNGKTLRVVAAHSKSMGMVASCHLTQLLIESFHPKTLVMTGFCGGLPGEVEMGDLIIAEKSWDWQSGKWTDEGFQHAPDQKEASNKLVALASSLGAQAKEFMLACASHKNPGVVPTFRVGPMLTGSAVVTADQLHDMFHAQHRKAIAVDMECYGVYYAAFYAEDPKPHFLCIKTVSDLSGAAKGKEFQKYGSALSAEVAMKALLNYFS